MNKSPQGIRTSESGKHFKPSLKLIRMRSRTASNHCKHRQLGSHWGHTGVKPGHWGVTLGSHWGHTGVKPGHWGVTLGSHWGTLGSSLDIGGSHWGHTGVTLGHSLDIGGSHWGLKWGQAWALGGHTGVTLGHTGVTLGSSLGIGGSHWGHTGVTLGSHGVKPGHWGVTLGSHWGHTGVTLKSSLDIGGSHWKRMGAGLLGWNFKKITRELSRSQETPIMRPLMFLTFFSTQLIFWIFFDAESFWINGVILNRQSTKNDAERRKIEVFYVPKPVFFARASKN